MHIVSVILDDYGAYLGRHEFCVSDRGLVLVLGENLDEPKMNSNGAAKSTLFEAIDWALFGVPSKGDHADSVVHDEAEGCGVSVVVQDDNGSVGVVERRRPSAVKFEVDGEKRTAPDSRETQRLINQWLGLDREVFHAAVFFGQEDLQRFADAKDSQRMEILTRIIPELAEIDILLERAKERRKTQEPIHAEAKRILDSLSGEISALEGYDFTQGIQQWERERADRVIGMKNELGTKQQEQTALMATTQHRSQWQEAIAEFERRPRAEVPRTIQGLDTTRVSLGHFREQRASLEGEKKQYETQLHQIQRTGLGRCPVCGTVVSQEHLAYESQRLQNEIAARMQAMKSLNDNITMLQREESELIRRLDQEVAKVKQQQRQENDWLFKARSALHECMIAQENINRLGKEMESLVLRITTEQQAENPFHVQQKTTEERLIQLRVDWRRAKALEAQSSEALDALEFWVDAFGPHGLKSLILDTKLQELTDAANEWVRLLTGGTMWVRFESQRLGRTTKTLRNAPSIRVFRYQPDGRVLERNYRSWSGGEKQRVSWAVDFGLSRLVARRASKKWDLLILDEVFKHVDSRGGQAVVEMLSYLQREKNSIFVIEHDSTFQGHFESVITVQKQRGRSRIIEASNEKEQEPEVQDTQKQVQKDNEKRVGSGTGNKVRKRRSKKGPKREARC
jgi:DNA repair exonuclease SbcCD ATPase subunit